MLLPELTFIVFASPRRKPPAGASPTCLPEVDGLLVLRLRLDPPDHPDQQQRHAEVPAPLCPQQLGALCSPPPEAHGDPGGEGR